MSTWLANESAFLFFATACLVAFGVQWLWLHQAKVARPLWPVWMCAGALLAAAWLWSDAAGRREADHVRSLTQDFALFYADDLERLGHWKLPTDAPTNSPLYLALIQTEIRWEELNPDVADIYTLRKLPGGKNVFIVDSETDYDCNGVFDGAREQRTPIGEVYDKPDEGLERAFRGTANFDIVPITDRWGTWISAFVPLRAPDGRLDGVLGVDFDARAFLSAIEGAKIHILSLFALLQLMLLASSTLILVLRGQNLKRKRLIGELQTALAEVKTLHGLIPICGWCKKVRNDQGYWSSVESYVHEHSDATFSHGVCPECREKFKAELDRLAPRDKVA